jgi:hypothetical protein
MSNVLHHRILTLYIMSENHLAFWYTFVQHVVNWAQMGFILYSYIKTLLHIPLSSLAPSL